MSTVAELKQQASELSDDEKLELVEILIAQVTRRPAEHRATWATEVNARHKALLEGRLTSVPYEEFVEKYRNR